MKLGLFFVALSGAAAQDSNDPDYDYSLIEWADGLSDDGSMFFFRYFLIRFV